MKARIIKALLGLLGRISGKRFIYYTPSEDNALGRTAVRSTFGFWYVGNVYDSNDIAYGIAQHGQVEEEETALVGMILAALAEQKVPVLYDIGANTGYYSIYASSVYGAHSYSFEPLPEHIECLAASIRMNRLESLVTPYQIALSDKAEEREFYLGGSGSSFDAHFLGNASAEHMAVQTVLLDTLRLQENIPHPDFIKIDVEGFEYEVLQGSLETLRASFPVLFIEIASTLKNLSRGFSHEKYEQIFEVLEELGYKAFILGNGVREVTSQDKTDGVHMYLFLSSQNPIHTTLLATIENI